MSRAPLAVTLGEPAGIGPEIVAAAWRTLRADGPCFFVVGDANAVVAPGAPVARIEAPAEAQGRFAGALPVLD
ncbi:MAG: 4-hydroxythreonine-4-phosphate dehydrogenase PdxA, partial [Caulobacteraceae bacterium]